MILNRCQVITSRRQVIAYRSSVSSNSMSSNKHSRYHYQENSTDMNTRNNINIENQYEYMKTIQLLENNMSNGFKLYTTIKIKIIVELSSGQATCKQAYIQAEISKLE